MPETRATWMAKTIGLVIVAAVATAALTTVVQQLIWKTSNPGVGGGAAAGVAVAIWMSRRKVPIDTSETPKP